jgi:hypothetical protein
MNFNLVQINLIAIADYNKNIVLSPQYNLNPKLTS